MLLPKIQRNSRFPARWTMLPWRNIDTSTDSQTDLSGKPGGAVVGADAAGVLPPDLVGGPELVEREGPTVDAPRRGWRRGGR